MKDVELYLKFRAEIDNICVPEILKCVETIPITATDKHLGKEPYTQTIGLLCVAHLDEWDYIDCLYLLPEYRRNGIGRKVAVTYWKQSEADEIRLHIIHANKPAIAFWNSIFKLEEIESNNVDALYRIRGLK